MDSLDAGLLAGMAVNVLSPYFSALSGRTMDALMDSVADKATSKAFKGAERLLDLVKKQFNDKVEAKKHLADLEVSPNNPATQEAVAKDLRATIRAYPDFASALSEQITQIANTRAEVAFVNNIKGDVKNLVSVKTVHGDLNIS